MVTTNANEEGTLLFKFFQWLVLCEAHPGLLQIVLSKAFSNGLFLQRKSW